jgi:hypothetical protein
MKWWWKLIIVLSLTVIIVVLLIIFLDEIGVLIGGIISAIGLGTAGEIAKRGRKHISPGTASSVKPGRKIPPGKPDEEGYVQLESEVADTKEKEPPEGYEKEDIKHTTEIEIKKNENEKKPETENHFVSGLSRGKREEYRRTGEVNR